MDSITFYSGDETKNTYDSWGLVPVTPIDAPYVYEGKREGVITFMMRFGNIPASIRLSDLETFMSNTIEKAEFSMDPGYYYTGDWRIEVTETNGVGVKVEFSHSLDEFKKEKKATNEELAWDDMNFDSGVVSDSIFSGIKVDSQNSYTTFPVSSEELKKHIGDEAVTPEFLNKSDSTIRFKIDGIKYKLDAGEKKEFEGVVFDPKKEIEILVMGKGEYDICFNKGVY